MDSSWKNKSSEQNFEAKFSADDVESAFKDIVRKLKSVVSDYSTELLTPTQQIQLFTVRHGHAKNNELKIHNSSNNEDESRRFGLTPTGKRQVIDTASILKDFQKCGAFGTEPVNIYSSPLHRAMETAEILNGHLNPKVPVENQGRAAVVVPERRLTEISAGDKDNMPYDKETANGIWDHSDAAEYGGETYVQLQVRLLSLLADLLSSGKSCVVVSHGSPICMLQFIHYMSNSKYYVLCMKQQHLQEYDLTAITGKQLKNFQTQNADMRILKFENVNGLLVYAQYLRDRVLKTDRTPSSVSNVQNM